MKLHIEAEAQLNLNTMIHSDSASSRSCSLSLIRTFTPDSQSLHLCGPSNNWHYLGHTKWWWWWWWWWTICPLAGYVLYCIVNRCHTACSWWLVKAECGTSVVLCAVCSAKMNWNVWMWHRPWGVSDSHLESSDKFWVPDSNDYALIVAGVAPHSTDQVWTYYRC